MFTGNMERRGKVRAFCVPKKVDMGARTVYNIDVLSRKG